MPHLNTRHPEWAHLTRTELYRMIDIACEQRNEARELVRRLVDGLDDPLTFLRCAPAPPAITRELLPAVSDADDAIEKWDNP